MKSSILNWALVVIIMTTAAGRGENQLRQQSHKDSNVITDHQPETGQSNRLIHAQSPYLLQHAYNPVDWYEWGDEAFETARREHKPIFLSIGYSTCHWCHVMAHESFEDEEVARLLNENFICIKVDREERPDIDHLYMTVCQMITGSGGWPLTIMMTPEKEPFFAGTYFPRESRPGRIGMLELIPRIADLWNSEQKSIATSTQSIMEALQRSQDLPAGQDLTSQSSLAAMEAARIRFDPVYGGFSQKPKFPTPHQLLFLLRYWYRTGESSALDMVEKTLASMRLGGIYDHVGFGFHRYSTDEHWLLPHFEKMLYDQALLTLAYTEAYQATRRREYANTAREIIAYVLRDLTAPEGAFYSAEDADSEGEEGKFYVWTAAEIKALLPDDDARWVASKFNLRPEGNFLEEATGQATGDNVLHLSAPLAPEEYRQWDRIRDQLLSQRENRVRPQLDDKILTDWNGLMVAALARAGQVLEMPEFIAHAENAARFLLGTMQDEHQRLLHRYRDGQAGIRAHLDDYAFLIWGLLDLYETTFNIEYLTAAIQLNRTMIDLFWDEQDGGFFLTAHDAEQLLVRSKEIYDGAIPSGNSVAALNLLRLGRMTSDPDLEQRVAVLGRTFAGFVNQSPLAFTQLLCAVEFATGPAFEVVIAGQPGARDASAMLSALQTAYHPHKVILFHPDGETEELARLAPFVKHQTSLDGKATAYICRNYACQAPTTDPAAMLAAFKQP
jgi:uncharacterized protein YyaL (SSP411 family)